jgi:autotransporter-associated beta strand protein
MVPSLGFAASGVYSNTTSGGLWSSSANWTGGTIADGQGATADFSQVTLAGSNTVHLDSSRTIGQLNFGDVGNQYGWILDNNGNASNQLTLSTGTTSAPVINVNNQTATISANLGGTQGFTLNGGGILTLSGNSTYTGVTTVASGTLVLGSSSSSSSSGPTAGAILDIDPQLSTITTSSGAVTAVSDLAGGSGLTSGYGTVGVGSINGHKAFSFNGASYLAGSSYSAANPTATVFAVVQPTSVASYSAIVASLDGAGYGGLELRLNQTSAVVQALDEGHASFGVSTTAVPLNALDVLAYSYNSSGGTVYLNGTAILTTSAPTFSNTSSITNSDTLLVGGKYSGGSHNEFFTGNIGTLLEYNTALSASQILSTSNFLSSEYATSSTTIGTTEVNLTSSSSNLAINSSSQSVSSLAGVANSNVYLGSGILTVGSDNTNTTFNGNISDSGTGTAGTGGSLIKVGSGTLTLGGNITNTGGEQVTAGALSIAGADSTSGPTTVSGGSLTVIPSGTYAVSGDTTVTSGTLTVAGIDSDSGNHTISGSNTSGGTMVISGTNNTSGNFTINNYGTLTLSGVGNNGGAITIGNGGSLTLVANATNTTGSGSSATSSAIGNPSSLTYAGGGNTTNVLLQSDSSVTFANSGPSGGTGSGAVINYYVNPLTTATNQTLSLSSNSTNGMGYATYQTTIHVFGSNGYTLEIPSISNAYSAYLTLNASTGNLSIPGGIASVGTLTVNGAANTSLGAISGTGPLIKSGAGTLSLTGSNTYTGSTNISSGALVLGSGASLTTSSITLSGGATFDISAVPTFALSSSTATLSGSGTIVGPYNHSVGTLYAGSSSSVGTLNISGGLTLNSTATLDVTLNPSNNSTGGLANDLINVTGPLNLVGSNVIALTPLTSALPVGSTWTILTYTGTAPTGTGTLNVSGSQFSVVEVPGAIELKYTSGVVNQDVWTGSVNSNWDTSTTNFVAAGLTAPIAFANGDAVTFDDTSTVTGVSLATNVQPVSVTVSSNSSNYTFSGSGSITGSASLLKSGTSTLTINNANTYTGTTNISGGTLVDAPGTTGAGIGAGPLIVGVGATLQIGDGTDNGSAASGNLIQNSSIIDNGTIVIAGRPSETGTPVFPAGINGTGSVVITSGVVGIGGTAAAGNGNNFSGGVMLVGSTPDLEAYESDSLGTGLVTVDVTTFPSYAGSTLDLGYQTFTYANAFNLSGYALQTYGGSSTDVTTITGPVNLFDQSTAIIDLYYSLVFTNNVTATSNQNLIVRNLHGVINSLTFGGNVSLGTGNLQSGSALIFAPPSATTITISTAGIQDYGGHSASVQQNGLGTTILDGTNTYSGGTTVTSGTLVFNSPGALPNFSALTIAATGTAQVANYNAGSTKNTLFTSSLTIATGGKLDLGNNDLVVQNGNLKTITAEIALGYSGGSWNGTSGITSSAAAADPNHLHGLGVILNVDSSGNTLYGGDFPSFDGATQSSSTDVLVKYTYYGDANLDGQVNSSDYTQIDAGYLSHGALTGWQNGDFNYDGVINGSDYTLIDNAFNTQGAQIDTQIASPTAAIAGFVTTAVPEPASLGLIGIGAVGLLSRRRRR